MKLSRNAPCPCGSGLKYKRCCSAPDLPVRSDLDAGIPPDPASFLTEEVLREARGARIWEADIAPMLLSFETDPAARPAFLAVLADGLTLHLDVIARPPREVPEVAFRIAAAVRAAAAHVGSLPEQLEVRQVDLVEPLEAIFRGEGMAVEFEPLPDFIDEFMIGLARRVGAPPDERPVTASPERWEGWDLGSAEAEGLFESIVEFHRTSPWENLEPLDLLGVTLPDGDRWFIQVFGGGEEPGGLVLFRDLEDALHILSSDPEKDPAADLFQQYYALTLWEKDELPEGMVEEIASHGWPIASPGAFPRLMSFNSPGGGISTSDVRVLNQALRIVAAYSDAGTPGFVRDWILDSHLEADEVESAWDDVEHRWTDPDPIWTDSRTGIEISFYGFILAEVLTGGSARLPFDYDSDGDPFPWTGPEVDPDDPLHTLGHEIRTQLEALLEGEVEPTPDQLEHLMEAVSGSFNTRPQPDMGGLTPDQVHTLLGQDWDTDPGPLVLEEALSLGELQGSSLFRNTRLFLENLANEEGTRATQAGNLNRAFVHRMYTEGDWGDRWWEVPDENRKVLNEEDLFALHELRVLLELATLVRRKGGKFVVTRTAPGLLADGRAGQLFAHLFRTQFRLMNLAYGDRFGMEGEVEFGLPYTLARLGTVARDWIEPDELAPLVLLPAVRRVLRRDAGVGEGIVLEHRVLRRLERFGLLESRPMAGRPDYSTSESHRVTPLFDRFVRVRFGGGSGGPGREQDGGEPDLRLI